MANGHSIASSPAAGTRVRRGFGPGFAYLILWVGALTLAVTGIGTFFFGKPPMTHWVLMLHVGASPLFSIGLALVALTWSARLPGESRVRRFFFWLMLLAGLVVILSGVVPMTPVFGTEGQHTLYLVHRYSAMVAAAFLVLHFLSPRARR